VREDTGVAAQVRQARPDDAAPIATVHVRSWQAAYRGLLPQEYLDGLDPADRVARWRDTLLAQGPEPGPGEPLLRALVAVDDGVIRGFASFGPTRDPDEDPQRTGEVYAIYLLPQSWGRGLGRMLMAATVSQLASAYAQATLWVLDTNQRARQFYARSGWAEDGSAKLDDSRGFAIAEVRYRRSLL
jgi:GNAT superfamily N-acetyltransferase